MAVFDNVRQKFADVTRTAVKASSDFLEVSKINMAIKSEENRIRAIMLEMGKSIYESYNDGKPVENEFASKCDEISLIQKDISEMKEKIIEIKSLRLCQECSSQLHEGTAFCPHCGTKVL